MSAFRLACGVWLLLFGVGCDSKSELGSEYCDALAIAVCEKLARCAPAGLSRTHGDIETCETRWAAFCGSLDGAQHLDRRACDRVITSDHCQGWVSGIAPPECATPLGTTADAGQCGADHECSSGYCRRKEACGECAFRAPQGGPCTTPLDCQSHLVCVGSTCTAPAVLGDGCSSAKPCAAPLRCEAGTCAAGLGEDEACGACTPGESDCVTSSASGAPDAPGSPGCDAAQGLICTGGTCRRAEMYAPGGECAIDGLCTAGSTCVASGSGNACAPARDLRDECDSNAPCAPPLHCVSGTCASLRESSCD